MKRSSAARRSPVIKLSLLAGGILLASTAITAARTQVRQNFESANVLGDSVTAPSNTLKHFTPELIRERLRTATLSGDHRRPEPAAIEDRPDLRVASRSGLREIPFTKLYAATPGGQRTIFISADDAVNRAEAFGYFSHVATGSAKPVSLTLENNRPVYQISGQKQVRLFGIIPFTVSTTTLVSGDTGNVVGQQTSLLNRVLQLFSR